VLDGKHRPACGWARNTVGHPSRLPFPPPAGASGVAGSARGGVLRHAPAKPLHGAGIGRPILSHGPCEGPEKIGHMPSPPFQGPFQGTLSVLYGCPAALTGSGDFRREKPGTAHHHGHP
jgi:hypothetical protein